MEKKRAIAEFTVRLYDVPAIPDTIEGDAWISALAKNFADAASGMRAMFNLPTATASNNLYWEPEEPEEEPDDWEMELDRRDEIDDEDSTAPRYCEHCGKDIVNFNDSDTLTINDPNGDIALAEARAKYFGDDTPRTEAEDRQRQIDAVSDILKATAILEHRAKQRHREERERVMRDNLSDARQKVRQHGIEI